MAKIDKINVGGTVYDINLPTTATPSISSLTISGNLTVEGTSNLSVINCKSLTALSYFDVQEVGFVYSGDFMRLEPYDGMDIIVGSEQAKLTIAAVEGYGDFLLSTSNNGMKILVDNGRGLTISSPTVSFTGKLYLNNKEMNAVSVIKNSDNTVTLSITNF